MTACYVFAVAGPAESKSCYQMASGQKLNKLNNIQALRAFAALSVVLSHSGRWLWTSRNDAFYHQVFNDHLGTFGVIIFFAVSGFLMSQLARATDASTFLVHRIARIYPIFVVCAVIWIPLRAQLGDSSRLDIAALTLAPIGIRDYPLGIEWTLIYEISFYMLIYFLCAAGLRRYIELIAIAWVALLVSLSISGSKLVQTEPFPYIHSVLLKDANIAFAIGLLLPAAIHRCLVPLWFCALGAPLAVAGIWSEVEPIRLVLALPAALIVAGLAQSPQMTEEGWLQRISLRLGDWSYALYLIHMPILTLWYKLGSPDLPNHLLFWLSILSAISFSAAFGAIDTRFYRTLRFKVDRLAPPLRITAGAGFAAIFMGVGALSLARVVVRWGWP